MGTMKKVNGIWIDTIQQDGVEYYGHEKLGIPKRDDFFVPNGDEIKFGGIYQPLGNFNDSAFERAQKEHSNSFTKVCSNRAGYYCKEWKCQFPKCLKDREVKPEIKKEEEDEC